MKLIEAFLGMKVHEESCIAFRETFPERLFIGETGDNVESCLFGVPARERASGTEASKSSDFISMGS
jgi:hypothetical protein